MNTESPTLTSNSPLPSLPQLYSLGTSLSLSLSHSFESHGKPNSAPIALEKKGRGKEDIGALDSSPAFASAPSKIVTKKMRIQFTCGFKEMPPLLWGRIDLKGLKTIIGQRIFWPTTLTHALLQARSAHLASSY